MYLTINSLGDLVEMVVELKKAGFLKDVHSKELMDAFGEKSFPIQVPVDLEGLLGILGNPIVKPFKGKIELKIHRIWETLETG